MEECRKAVIKRGGGDLKMHPHQIISNSSFSKKNLLPLSQYHTGSLIIDVQDKGSDFRMRRPKRSHEMIFGGKNGRRKNQYHQNFTTFFSNANQNVPK